MSYLEPCKVCGKETSFYYLKYDAFICCYICRGQYEKREKEIIQSKKERELLLLLDDSVTRREEYYPTTNTTISGKFDDDKRKLINKTEFSNEMRKLWEDHIIWTRCYIISAVHNLPDIDMTLKRLLKNQEDLGSVFGRIYNSRDVGEKVTKLLKEHIVGAGAIIAEAKSRGSNVEKLKKEWYVNAKEIAVALHNLNRKFWKEKDLLSLMNKHLDDTLKEAVNRLSGNYSQDIIDYEKIHLHILMMADALSQGIIKQFPDIFQ